MNIPVIDVPADALPPLPDSPATGSWWRHRKGGVYQVVCLARHSETREATVVYRSQEGEVWVRPHAMFTDGRFARADMYGQGEGEDDDRNDEFPDDMPG